MKCPNCGLINPDIAQLCDCGYNFTIAEPKDSPFDQDSLRIFGVLPRRSSSINTVLTLIQLLSIPILVIGAIGLAKVLLPALRETSEYKRIVEEDFVTWILTLLFACGIFAAGGALRFVARYYKFEKAPLGSLVQLLFEELAMNKDASKIRTIAECIYKQTKWDIDYENIPRLFARAFASEVLAETSDENEAARTSAEAGARDYERLEQLGVNTPLLHFGMATCLRIMKENTRAIESYKKYLSMHPDDGQSKSIMEDLIKQSQQD